MEPTRPPRTTYATAEYDHKTNRILALKTATGEVHSTGAQRVLGAKTEWVRVETILPEGYDPQFHSLLYVAPHRGQDPLRYTYDPDGNRVVVEFPYADFSVEAMRERLRRQAKESAHTALMETDWYVIRQVETGVPIPEDIKAVRESIRQRADTMEGEIRTLSATEIGEYDMTLPPTLMEDEPPPPGGDGSEWRTDATEPGQKGSPVRPVEPYERNVDREER